MKWEKRDLTLFGKVQVLKILALPKIILSATILHVPQDVISELTKMFFKFLWGKVDRVKRLKVIQDHFNGGLGIIDIESLFTSFKASWLHRIKKADSENDSWVLTVKNKLLSLFHESELDENSFLSPEQDYSNTKNGKRHGIDANVTNLTRDIALLQDGNYALRLENAAHCTDPTIPLRKLSLNAET